MGVEKWSDDSMRPEQKEVLDSLVRRFFDDGKRCLLVERPLVWVRHVLLWSLLGSFGGVGVGAGFW
jgi:hypothetical protein